MNGRKGLMIGIVIVCVALAGVTYVVMSPKNSTEGSEYEQAKTKSEQMAEAQRQNSNTRRPDDEPIEEVERPSGKGPQKVGG